MKQIYRQKSQIKIIVIYVMLNDVRKEITKYLRDY